MTIHDLRKHMLENAFQMLIDLEDTSKTLNQDKEQVRKDIVGKIDLYSQRLFGSCSVATSDEEELLLAFHKISSASH